MWWIIAGLVFVGFFFATCVCCACVIYTFNSQTTTTDLSSDWSEVSGGWATDGTYITTTDTNAILIHNQETPSEGGYLLGGLFTPSTYVSIGNRSGSDKLRVFFNYVDTNNWHCLEFGDVTKLIKKTSGSEATVAQLDSESSSLPSRICVRDSGLVVWNNDQINHAWATYTTLHSGGKKWGFGTGDTNAGGVFVNMPSVSRYNAGLVTPTTTQDGSCPPCGVSSGCRYYGSPLDDDPPQFVQVEIISIPNGTSGTTCDALDGTTWICEYRGSWQSTSSRSRWVADISSGGAEDFKKMVVDSNGTGTNFLWFFNTTSENYGTASGGTCGRALQWTPANSADVCVLDTPRTFSVTGESTLCCDWNNASAEVTWLS